MPSTPSQIGAGITAWTCTVAVDETERAHVRELLSALGRELFHRILHLRLAAGGNDEMRAGVEYLRRRVVLGAPATVKARLLDLQVQFEADELMVITITGDYRTRFESYRLLAAAFDLRQPDGGSGR